MTGEDIARAYWEHSRRRDPMLPRWEGLAPAVRRTRGCREADHHLAPARRGGAEPRSPDRRGRLMAEKLNAGHAANYATAHHAHQAAGARAQAELVEASEEVLPLGGGDVEGLVELGELLAARRGSAGLPLRDGLLGDADLPGEVGLGEAAPSADTFDERGHGEGVLGHRRSR